MLQTQNVAGGTNWREIYLLIQEPETASDTKMFNVVFDHPRYVLYVLLQLLIA